MSTLKSTEVAQVDASFPSAVANVERAPRVKFGTMAVATTDAEADDVIVLGVFGLDDVILKIEIANDDLDSSTAILFDVGLYADVEGATALDDDVYATVSTQFQSATGYTDLAHEARGIQLTGQAIWADAGYSDRESMVDAGYSQAFLAIHIDTVAGTPVAGDVAYRITYVDG